MARELYLIRHAEAHPLSSGMKDTERDITSKGYVDITRMGNFLFDQGVRPNLVLTSSAIRAARTAEILSEQIRYDLGKINMLEDLYEASVRTILQIINKIDVEHKVVAVVGHNPSIAYLAEYISNATLDGFNPSSVVHLKFEVESWLEVSEGTGDFINHYNPDSI